MEKMQVIPLPQELSKRISQLSPKDLEMLTQDILTAVENRIKVLEYHRKKYSEKN